MNNYIKNYKEAFTLAEVLMTLLIIGIVASMVIPALINDTQNAELKTAMKKEVAVITQAGKMVIMDNGGTAKGLCSDNNYVIRARCIRDEFLQYMSYTKKCSSSPEQESFGICFVKPSWLGGPWKNLNGTDSGYGSDATAVINDGSLLHFCHLSSDCNYNGTRICTRITFDVNGFKGPNVTGKDIFVLWLYDDRIKPYGISDQPSLYMPGAELTAQYLQQ